MAVSRGNEAVDAPSTTNVWSHHARQWEVIGSPLRPTAEDIQLLQQYLPPSVDGPVLLLGVTAELRVLATQLVAVDHSDAMVARFHAQPVIAGQSVQLGDWRALDQYFSPQYFAAALGDGSLNMLHFPTDYTRLFNALAVTLRVGAPFACRLFAAPSHTEVETPEAVFAAAEAGRIGSFHAFKWRLAHALVAQQATPNIAVQDIFTAFAGYVPDRDALAACTGWPRAHIDTIDAYAQADTVYSFPSLDALAAILPHGWQIRQHVFPSYELGERCPILQCIYVR
jgi:hypothetical protein